VHTLFRDEFYPATEALGFIRAPAEDVAHAYAEWSSRLGFATRTTKHETDLRRTMPLLEPLTHDPSRVIIAATQNRDWSAVFTNSARGNDPTSAIAVLSKDLRTDGVKVVYTPDVRGRSGITLDRLGARIFFYTADDAANERSIAVPSRTIYLARQSGSRWLFEAKGEPLAFEDVDAYRRHRATERFTPEMLEQYCRALGLDPFTDDFYTGPCFHLEEDASAAALASETTFRERQRKWQITPGSPSEGGADQ
jgi:hypothetical protein